MKALCYSLPLSSYLSYYVRFRSRKLENPFMCCTVGIGKDHAHVYVYKAISYNSWDIRFKNHTSIGFARSWIALIHTLEKQPTTPLQREEKTLFVQQL